MKIKAIIEYDGTGFYGWQFQPDRPTVQDEVEKALRQVTREEIRITGCGRTDAGVHAADYVSSFDYSGELALSRLVVSLNSVLPRAIFIKSLAEAAGSFDARRDASSKLYRYRIIRGRSPLRRTTAWEYHYPLDIARMKSAAQQLLGAHDYAALCEVSDSRQTLTVNSIDITEADDEIIVDIRGKSFLYKMVRRMVGIMTECGRGKIDAEIIPRLFSRTKPVQTITAPANGLTLVGVDY